MIYRRPMDVFGRVTFPETSIYLIAKQQTPCAEHNIINNIIIILYNAIQSAAAKSSACGDRRQLVMNNNKGVALRLQTEVVRVDYTALGQYPGSGFYGPIKILRFLNDNLHVLRLSAAEFQGLISEYWSSAVVISSVNVLLFILRLRYVSC